MSRVHTMWFSILVLVVFTAGIGTGALLHGYLQPPASLGPPLPPPPGLLIARISSELDLTPAQQKELEQIVSARRRKFDAMRIDMRMRFERDASELAADIRRILTPEQRNRFEEFVAHVRTKFLDYESATRMQQP